jgi:hypothetical protein
VRPSILDVDPELWLLKFDFEIQALLNHEAWREWHEQAEVAAELGEPEPPRPRVPIAFRWVSPDALGKLSSHLVGHLTLPRLNPATDRVECVDWEQLAAWRADVASAVNRLPLRQRRAFCLALAGKEVYEIARMMGWPWRDTLQELRAANSFVRGWAEERGGPRPCRRCGRPTKRIQAGRVHVEPGAWVTCPSGVHAPEVKDAVQGSGEAAGLRQAVDPAMAP